MKLPPIDSRQDFFRQFAQGAFDDPVSVVLIDIDGFKEVNDLLGHEAGDRVLARVWEELTEERERQKGSVTMIGRTGGDEFAMAIAGSAEASLLLLDPVRRALAGRASDERGSPQISISAGIATWPAHTEEPEQLIAVASEALHRAKREGRNRIAIYVEEKMVLKSNYYSRAQLGELSRLAKALERSEASLLREALSDISEKYRADL